MANAIKKKVLRYTAVFEPDAEAGGYTAYIPALPGCISEGDTFEAALRNITEAAELYIEVMHEQKEEVPHESEGVVVAPVRVRA
jgi:predicted RNase H-like HicB family nuclease